MVELQILDSDSKIIKVLKSKIIDNNGIGHMPVLRGKPIKFELAKDNSGVVSDGLKGVVLEWKIFDEIIKKAIFLGGKMFRGDSFAQAGCKLGSKELSLDTIDGYISYKFFNTAIGKCVLRRSTYYSGILAWAGIVENHRSKGQGGYITVNSDFMTE